MIDKVIYWFTVIVSLVIFYLFATGCSAQWHVQRAVIKDPSILEYKEVRLDTVVVTQPRYLADTVVVNDVDSVTIVQDRVVTKLWRVHDTIRVETICPPDSVEVEVIKYVPQVKYIPLTWWQKNRWWIFLVIGITLSYSVFRRLK